MKYFTVEQANRTLPLVQRIVTDIVAEYARWREKVDRYELIAAGSRSDRGESPEQVQARGEVEALAQSIERYLQELGQVGCVLKGFDDGLVDFRSQRGGRDIFLCWKLGEPAVEHWHDVEAGFAGRQPL